MKEGHNEPRTEATVLIEVPVELHERLLRMGAALGIALIPLLQDMTEIYAGIFGGPS
jgi:hypothetical protein